MVSRDCAVSTPRSVTLLNITGALSCAVTVEAPAAASFVHPDRANAANSRLSPLSPASARTAASSGVEGVLGR